MRLLQQPQIILLREGTDTSQGKAQLISNINACMAVVDTVRTTLGPRGMDKLVHDDKVCRCVLHQASFSMNENLSPYTNCCTIRANAGMRTLDAVWGLDQLALQLPGV